jgi:hypothetical protein
MNRGESRSGTRNGVLQCHTGDDMSEKKFTLTAAAFFGTAAVSIAAGSAWQPTGTTCQAHLEDRLAEMALR